MNQERSKNMNKIKLLIGLVLACAGLSVNAQQYGLLTTLESHQATNGWPTATASNLNAVVTLTRHDEFILEVVGVASNAMAGGSLAIQWEKSADGVNYPGAAGLPTMDGHQKGWFAIPFTNSATIVWSTNINVASHGYWRARYVTNASGEFLTNLTIKAYAKPRTDG